MDWSIGELSAMWDGRLTISIAKSRAFPFIAILDIFESTATVSLIRISRESLMQTYKFLQLINRVVNELVAVDIVACLSPLFTPGTPDNLSAIKPQFSDLVFKSQNGYFMLSRDPETTEFLKRLKLTGIYSSPNLTRLLNEINRQPDWASLRNQSFALFLELYTSMNTLVALNSMGHQFLQSKTNDLLDEGNEIIDLEINDFDNSGIYFRRLYHIFKELQLAYDNTTVALGKEKVAIKLVGADSGSNTLFSFEGSGDVIRELRKLFEFAGRKSDTETMKILPRRLRLQQLELSSSAN